MEVRVCCLNLNLIGEPVQALIRRHQAYAVSLPLGAFGGNTLTLGLK